MTAQQKAELENAGTFQLPTAGRNKRFAWKKIFLGFVAVIAALAILIAMQPSDFRVSRSAMMSAPPAAVFDQVNNFHHWDAWSPWAKLDPAAKSYFDGPTSGKWASFSWDGNSDVGAGSMKILESRPHELIRIRLDFVRPFVATNDVTFTFQPDGDRTAVTWSMAGTNNFLAKAISLVIDCEKMVGEQFEQGLANIESIVEAKPDQRSST